VQFDPKDLETLGVEIAKVGAPIIGNALGGPLGSMIAGSVVDALAGALGVPATPADVTTAVRTNPAAPAACQQIEAAHQEDVLPVLQLIADSEKVELTSGDRFVRWARPSAIWTVSGATAAYSACVIAATVKYLITGDTTALAILLTNAAALSIALAPAGAIAGVTAWWRSQEKIAGMPAGIDGAARKK
jgi:hypothetical protein